MRKKFMCANLQDNHNGCFEVVRKVACNLWPPDAKIPEMPYDWRDAAKAEASYKGADLKESDLIDVKGYIAFKIRTSVFFENKTFLDNIDLDQQLPEGYVVIGTPDGHPLIVCWEEDFVDVKAKTTEELKAILKEDCDSNSTGLNDEELFSVMAELAQREGKSSEDAAKEAWQRFQKYWMPGVRNLEE